MLDNGGHDLRTFVKRNMKFLMNSELARQYNLTGQKNKRAFKPLQLCEALYGMQLLSSMLTMTAFEVSIKFVLSRITL